MKPKTGNCTSIIQYFICAEIDTLPTSKEDIIQSNIYENQLAKYVNTENCRVAILNSFPIFLYDYFRDITENM